MDTSLEWKIVLDWRRFTSEHCLVRGEEEDRNNHGRTKWQTTWEEETWKKLRQNIFGVCELIDSSFSYKYQE